VQQHVLARLRGERDALAELPGRRCFAQDASRVGLAERAEPRRLEIGSLRDRSDATDAVEEKLTPKMQGIAGDHRGFVGRNAVHGERAATDPSDLEAPVCCDDVELTTREREASERRRGLEPLRALTEKSNARLSVTFATTERVDRAACAKERDFAHAQRLVCAPRDHERG